MTERLVLRMVTVRRGNATLLDDVTIQLHAGQLVALVGPNGAGKSTLLKAIAGWTTHSGRILWCGQAVDYRQVGFMPQQCQVSANLTVLETLLLGRHELLGWRVKDVDIGAASHILADLGLSQLADRAMTTLSGGQQQAVLLGQRLMRQPKLLLLDEVTSALDLRHQVMVLDLLKRYVARSGALVLSAMHDLNLAARNADTVLMMRKARVVAFGRAQEVFTPDCLRATYDVNIERMQLPDGTPIVVPV